MAAAIVKVAWLDGGWATLFAAAIVGLLGAEALLCAVRNRRCLLSRIGPLP